MFIHMRKRITTVLFTFTLLATPMIPVYAQDDDPAEPVIAADVNQPAATETMMSAEAVFTTDEPAATDTEPKSARQTTEKLVPNAEEAYAESDAKRHLYLPMITNGSGSGADVEAAATTAYWRTIKYEGFEGAFPNTAWRVSDCNGTNYGVQYWDDTSYMRYSGSWSGWAARGGANGRDPRDSFYPNNACSWMVYGPFSLSRAQNALLTFKYWNQSERNYDWLSWYVSCNGTNFTGMGVSGDSGGWRTASLSLNRCLRDSTVWIAFKFTSDSSIVDDGPFIDNIYIQEYR